MGSRWIPLLNFHMLSPSMKKKTSWWHVGVICWVLTWKVRFFVWNLKKKLHLYLITVVSECLCLSIVPREVCPCHGSPSVVARLQKNRWQTEVACVSVFQGRWAANVGKQQLDNSQAQNLTPPPPKDPLNSHYQWLSMTPMLNITKLCCHIDTKVCFVNTQSNRYCHRSNVMTLFPASPTDSHTFGQWQWTKLSPGFLRVIGELTFGLRGKQAHDRLVCGPPPGFHLCDP